MNQLQALAMNEGKHWKTKLWSQQGRAKFEKLPLAFWASRRQELLELLDRMNPTIAELTAAVEQEAQQGVALLADLPQPLLAGAGVLARNHSQVASDLLATRKPHRSSDDQHIG